VLALSSLSLSLSLSKKWVIAKVTSNVEDKHKKPDHSKSGANHGREKCGVHIYFPVDNEQRKDASDGTGEGLNPAPTVSFEVGRLHVLLP